MAVATRIARTLHKHIWQRLPRDARRSLLFASASHLAPRPAEHARTGALPIYVAGVLRAGTGLGQSARLCLAALRDAGLPVQAIDLTQSLFQDTDLPADETWSSHLPAGPGTLILHVNAQLMGIALMALGREAVRGKHIVGYWAWELAEIPRDWRGGPKLVHQIWAPSRFSAEAFRHAADRPVHVVPHPVLADPALAGIAKKAPEGSDGMFRVLTMFDMAGFARKNPLAAVAAFRQGLDSRPDCELTIKVQNGHLFSEGQAALREAVAGTGNIRVVDANLSRDRVLDLIRRSDAVLSLHRSEGFGLLMAEAMALGRVAIATGWSGNVDFMTPENSVLVGHKLVAAEDVQRTYDFPRLTWADADVADAVRALVDLAENEALRKQLADKARATAQRLFSSEAYGACVRPLLGLMS